MEKTLSQLVNENYQKFENIYEVMLSTGFPRAKVRASLLQILKDETAYEASKIAGMRKSDVPNTERGAWALARKQMIERLQIEIEGSK